MVARVGGRKHMCYSFSRSSMSERFSIPEEMYWLPHLLYSFGIKSCGYLWFAMLVPKNSTWWFVSVLSLAAPGKQPAPTPCQACFPSCWPCSSWVGAWSSPRPSATPSPRVWRRHRPEMGMPNDVKPCQTTKFQTVLEFLYVFCMFYVHVGPV